MRALSPTLEPGSHALHIYVTLSTIHEERHLLNHDDSTKIVIQQQRLCNLKHHSYFNNSPQHARRAHIHRTNAQAL
jgi:hypothetical protein